MLLVNLEQEQFYSGIEPLLPSLKHSTNRLSFTKCRI